MAYWTQHVHERPTRIAGRIMTAAEHNSARSTISRIEFFEGVQEYFNLLCRIERTRISEHNLIATHNLSKASHGFSVGGIGLNVVKRFGPVIDNPDRLVQGRELRPHRLDDSLRSA